MTPPIDALDPGPLDEQGRPTFPNAPRLEDGSIDWAAMGAEPPEYDVIDRDGRRHRIEARPTVPHPVTGEPVEPE